MGTEVDETFGLCGFFCSNIEIRSVRAFLAAGELMMFDFFFSRVWCQISLRSLISSSSFVAVRQFLNCMYKLTLKSSSYSCYSLFKFNVEQPRLSTSRPSKIRCYSNSKFRERKTSFIQRTRHRMFQTRAAPLGGGHQLLNS